MDKITGVLFWVGLYVIGLLTGALVIYQIGYYGEYRYSKAPKPRLHCVSYKWERRKLFGSMFLIRTGECSASVIRYE